MTHLERIGGTLGGFLIATTSLTTRQFNCVVANEDAIIASITYTGSATNVIASHGLSGTTLKAGMVLFCPVDKTFSTITLTSGSVVIH